MTFGLGVLTKRWHVFCNRCTEWDIPSGSKKTATLVLKESGWTLIGSKWICPKCSKLVKK